LQRTTDGFYTTSTVKVMMDWNTKIPPRRHHCLRCMNLDPVQPQCSSPQT